MDKTPKQQSPKFRPSEFMRARRPHLFSDSEVVEQARLDRATFEYHLETLTARKQELDFERFARKLAEKEICPNLRPQTGPTGGGDSKVDSETYPVSSEITDRIYYADPAGREGGTERWAFAFSTKKDWRAKAASDVKAIADTGRGYKKAIFITSQFAKDKDRAALEDKLSKTYMLQVVIHDRTWIVEKVFANKRESLAIETLKCAVPFATMLKKGPRDLSREAELKELEQQINDPDRYAGLNYQLVEDAIQAARLARGIELPRVEVEARFERALHIAEERGTKQQQLRCAYNKAWTYFWWYEDFASFDKAYDVVEKLAKGSSETSDIVLLQNLWQLFYATAQKSHTNAVQARIDERTALLKSELERIEKQQGRPSAALEAQARRLIMELSISYDDATKLKEALHAFHVIFEKSKGLIDFPAQHFVEMLMELSDLLPDNDEFDTIFESALELTRERQSRGVSGRLLLRRGSQKLKNGRPYEAIKLLGRAQQDLALQESRGEMVIALGLCAAAYEAAGLLWAARACMLVAANQALKDFWEHGQVTNPALACLRKLIWLELQLGCIPCVLAWIETFVVLNSAVDQVEDRQKRLSEEWLNLDAILGLLLLKADIFDLKDLSFLPHVLERFGLEASRIALLYALGYEDELRNEKAIPLDESSENVVAFFDKWLTQPAASDLPAAPEFVDKQTLELHSGVLGCDIVVSAPNNDDSLFLAEGILAGTEAFLATSLDSTFIPHASRVQIRVIPSDFLEDVLEFTVKTAPHTVIEVRHQKENIAAAEITSDLKDKLLELISNITAYIAMPRDESGKQLVELIRDEGAFGRALLISGVSTTTHNVLGEKPKIHISDWSSGERQDKKFPLMRQQAWNQGRGIDQQTGEKVRPTPGTGDAPRELFDVERLKHRDRKVFSLININLWNKAGWSGTGFAEFADPDEPPYLALLFENRDAAEGIFRGWVEEDRTRRF